MKKARKTNFTIYGENDIFEGYTIDTTWNGFEEPSFKLEVLKDIIKVYELKGVTYDKEKDVYYYTEESGGKYPLARGLDLETEDGKLHLYDFLGCWTWFEYDEEEED